MRPLNGDGGSDSSRPYYPTRPEEARSSHKGRTALEELISKDTIVALATPPGRAALGIVRMSGPDTLATVDRFFHCRETRSPRRARIGSFSVPGASPLDQVVLTVFERPDSYTGEDLAEISAHGNPLILNAIEGALISAGIRRARRGEFTLRAVANGKMDLAQAEAVRDFIEAETMAQARAAMRQLGGTLSRRVRPWKENLVRVVAALEAGIDFADDEIEPPPSNEIASDLDLLRRGVREVAGSFDYGRLLTGGILVAILGRPNVGKSSLFNRLIAQDRAIVTDVPGTTRDVLTETIIVGGVPMRIADTAGLREDPGPVERLGVERTLATLADADLNLVVLDGSVQLTTEDRELIARVDRLPVIVVINKRDLPRAWTDPVGDRAIGVSARTGEGLGDLERALEEWIAERRPASDDGFVVTSVRQRDALVRTADAMGRAAAALREGVPHEMVLVELYNAMEALGKVTGEVTTEDILDEIFSSFCVGK